MLIDLEVVETAVPIGALILQDRAQEHLLVERVRGADALELRGEKPAFIDTVIHAQPAHAVRERHLQVIAWTQQHADVHVRAVSEAVVREVDLLAGPAVR